MRYIYLVICLTVISCNASSDKAKQSESLYEYDVEAKLVDLGIELKPRPLPDGVKFAPVRRTGNLLYLSGNVPITPDGRRIEGKLGADLTIEQGYDAARLVAINHLAIIKEELGDLNKVVQLIKVLGMVNCEPTFSDQPKVINGYTDLMIEIFGERGRHARSAVGMSALPGNLACEIELIVEVID